MYMVFRLPTHLESLIPPPSEQISLSRPWRGAFVLNFVDGGAKSSSQEICVTAVETEGDSRIDLWPSQFYIYMTRDRSTLHDFQAWVRRHAPPICTFLPDRIGEPNATGANQRSFASLSRILLLNQMVAIAPWAASARLPGAGVVLYPSQHSNNLLFGAILLTLPFPDFIVVSPTASFSPVPTPRHSTYPQPHHMAYPSPYASTSHHILPQIISHQLPSSPSPTNYAYTTPRLISAGSLQSPSMAGPSSWSVMTDPDDEHF
ncbi:hypothetical protein PILCRDRAFT_822 [Piloderma croceum F 1598]|uniref:Uncharacterized protein n=1 Tax=Piloderma croceum (strain F 1598) TaxID=765440 RepID=A0A0C3GJA1_PILCF|nr:hypothetical protein PILCRDRAFT_822 [Piloderma croceum F 1598]